MTSKTHYRTHNCGELNINHLSSQVSLSGWIQKIRHLGSLTFIDLRDRYGISQLVINEKTDEEVRKSTESLGREFTIKIEGKVIERENKNLNIPTGEIEIEVLNLEVLSPSLVPPFTIEEETDGGDELRMKFRYLDIRRPIIRDKLIFRHQLSLAIRNYLSTEGFIEVETPNLIKSTPEGARDFIVPSRINPGEFYALPQSPQTFKQLLMVGGMDKYFQIVKCYRDEDLRADRQPEFTQVDCEMSFVNEEDVLEVFEKLVLNLFKKLKNLELDKFPRIPFAESMSKYGSDKPDIRFDLIINEVSETVKGKNFKIFDDADYIGGFAIPGASSYSRKQIDAVIDWVKRPQIGANGLIWIKHNEDDTFKSSVDKFYSAEDLKVISKNVSANPGDLIVLMAGKRNSTLKQLGELRLYMADSLGLRNPKVFAPLWVTDFPLMEWDEEEERYFAMHHPFTSPKDEDLDKLESDLSSVNAKAYDLVINGNEIGGGSIRIFDSKIQKIILKALGFSDEEAKKQFGFLMESFKYGAPPHGGIAFGLDRLVAIFDGHESIRDYIAFPKNNSGRDLMISAPSPVDEAQLSELGLKLSN